MPLEKEAHITTVGREIAVDDWPANCSTLYGDCSEGDGGRNVKLLKVHSGVDSEAGAQVPCNDQYHLRRPNPKLLKVLEANLLQKFRVRRNLLVEYIETLYRKWIVADMKGCVQNSLPICYLVHYIYFLIFYLSVQVL